MVLDSSKYVLYVQTVEGMPLRSVNLAVYEVLTLHVCPKSPFTVLIELPKSYDLVSMILIRIYTPEDIHLLYHVTSTY